MGACFHLPGVQCDNCRTGLSTTIYPEYVTFTPCRPDPLDAPVTKREVAELRAELDALKARLDAPAASEPARQLYLYQIGPEGRFSDYYVVLVVAESEDAARRIHPNPEYRWDEERQTWRWGWNEAHRLWTKEAKKPFIDCDTPIHQLSVRRLGVADPGLTRGTVLFAAPMTYE